MPRRIAVRVDRLQAGGIGVWERHPALLVRDTRESGHDGVGNRDVTLFCDRDLGGGQGAVVRVDQSQTNCLGPGQRQVHRPVGQQAREREFRDTELAIRMIDQEAVVSCRKKPLVIARERHAELPSSRGLGLHDRPRHQVLGPTITSSLDHGGDQHDTRVTEGLSIGVDHRAAELDVGRTRRLRWQVLAEAQRRG